MWKTNALKNFDCCTEFTFFHPWDCTTLNVVSIFQQSDINIVISSSVQVISTLLCLTERNNQGRKVWKSNLNGSLSCRQQISKIKKIKWLLMALRDRHWRHKKHWEDAMKDQPWCKDRWRNHTNSVPRNKTKLVALSAIHGVHSRFLFIAVGA